MDMEETLTVGGFYLDSILRVALLGDPINGSALRGVGARTSQFRAIKWPASRAEVGASAV